jgi:hypothetical protein
MRCGRKKALHALACSIEFQPKLEREHRLEWITERQTSENPLCEESSVRFSLIYDQKDPNGWCQRQLRCLWFTRLEENVSSQTLNQKFLLSSGHPRHKIPAFRL